MYKPPTKFWEFWEFESPGMWCRRCNDFVKKHSDLRDDEVGCRCATDTGPAAMKAAGYDDESTYITPQMEQNYSLTFSNNELSPTVPLGMGAHPFTNALRDIRPIQPMEPVPKELPEGRMIDFEDEE